MILPLCVLFLLLHCGCSIPILSRITDTVLQVAAPYLPFDEGEKGQEGAFAAFIRAHPSLLGTLNGTSEYTYIDYNKAGSSLRGEGVTRYSVDLSKPQRRIDKGVPSNFASFSMEWGGAVPRLFRFKDSDHFHAKEMQRLFDQLHVQGGTLPLVIRVGGNSIMKTVYKESKYTYPKYVYTQRKVGDAMFEVLGKFSQATGIKYIVALPMMERDKKYAAEWAEAASAGIGKEGIYAFELGNEPNHWGDPSKVDKRHLLKTRKAATIDPYHPPAYNHPVRGQRFAYGVDFDFYLTEVEELIDDFQTIDSLAGIPFQGPSAAGCMSRSNMCWIHHYPEIIQRLGDKMKYLSFHRYGASGFAEYRLHQDHDKAAEEGVSLPFLSLMSDPPNDSGPRNGRFLEENHGYNLKWVQQLVPKAEAKDVEVVWGEGNTMTGSGRAKAGMSFGGMVRSYEAGFLWGLNMLLEMSSRGVSRVNVHGVGGANFAPIFFNYAKAARDKDNYDQVIVTPIYAAMYYFNRLIDGGEGTTTITVPAFTTSDSEHSVFHRPYLLKNAAMNRDSFVFVHKGPSEASPPVHLSVPSRDFCPGEGTVFVDLIQKMARPGGKWDEDFDNYVPSINGLYFTEKGHLKVGEEGLQIGVLAAEKGAYSLRVEPLTVVALHCFRE